MKRLPSNQRGFTLPELLVTIVVFLGMLVGGFFLLQTDDHAVEHFNAGRRVDVALIVNAITKYHDEHGSVPKEIPTTQTVIGTEENNFDLCKVLVPKYIKDMPYDPGQGMKSEEGACNVTNQRYVSGYSIGRSEDAQSITVVAPLADNDETIMVKRQYRK